MALLIAVLFLAMCSACSNQENEDSASPDAATAAINSRFASFAAGDVITFGSFEQDDYLANGSEPIEWIVLDIKDGKALLLSKYGLDAAPYHTENEGVAWETCMLRAWLNNEFLNTAFDETQRSAIQTTEVDNSESQRFSKWDTDGGNNTQDKIFLLSYKEANQYLHVTVNILNNFGANCSPTGSAVSHGAQANSSILTSDGDVTAGWWLRSPGEYPTSASFVDECGAVNDDFVGYIKCIRPVFWLDLGSDII